MVQDLFNKFLQPLANCLNWIFEELLTPFFDNISNNTFVICIILSLGFCALVIFAIDLLINFINDYSYFLADMGTRAGVEYKQIVKAEERRIEAENRYHERKKQNQLEAEKRYQERKKQNQLEAEKRRQDRINEKYPDSIEGAGSALAEKYFIHNPNAISFSYRGQTFYNPSLFENYSIRIDDLPNEQKDIWYKMFWNKEIEKIMKDEKISQDEALKYIFNTRTWDNSYGMEFFRKNFFNQDKK